MSFFSCHAQKTVNVCVEGTFSELPKLIKNSNSIPLFFLDELE